MTVLPTTAPRMHLNLNLSIWEHVMPFVPITNVAKLLIRFVMSGQQVENVFYVKNTAAWTEESIAELVTTALTAIAAGDGLMPLLGANVLLSSVYAKDMTTEDGLAFEGSPLTPVHGGVTTAVNPNNVSLAIHKVSTVGGRHSRARVYVPGIPQSAMSDPNTVSPTGATDFCNAYRTFREAIETVSGFTLGFVELVNAHVPLSAGIFIPILDFICKDATIDSQRRRLPGRGR